MRQATIAFIICGALGREVIDIIRKYDWEVDVVGVSASDHLLPHLIAPDVEKRILQFRDQYEQVLVVFGDCGSSGALDKVLDKYDIDRIGGLHCYEWYAGQAFFEAMENEPGTFFLTDFLIRAFRGAVIKGLGLDRHPELKNVYYGNYSRVLYLAQNLDSELLEKAQQIAEYLELPLEVHETGYGLLESQLVEWMTQEDIRVKTFP